MRINFAHLRQPSTSGGDINFAVFEGRSTSGTPADNDSVLARWTTAARAQGLRIDQAALAYPHNGRIMFHGSRNLVQFLAENGPPRPTHYLDI